MAGATGRPASAACARKYRIAEAFDSPLIPALGVGLQKRFLGNYGILVGSDFSADAGGWVAESKRRGGHAMCAVGLREAGQEQPKVQWNVLKSNSWGTLGQERARYHCRRATSTIRFSPMAGWSMKAISPSDEPWGLEEWLIRNGTGSTRVRGYGRVESLGWSRRGCCSFRWRSSAGCVRRLAGSRKVTWLAGKPDCRRDPRHDRWGGDAGDRHVHLDCGCPTDELMRTALPALLLAILGAAASRFPTGPVAAALATAASRTTGTTHQPGQEQPSPPRRLPAPAVLSSRLRAVQSRRRPILLRALGQVVCSVPATSIELQPTSGAQRGDRHR